MRAAPPIQVSVQRFDAWQSAVVTLAAAGASAIGAWLLQHDRPIDAIPWAMAALAWIGIVVAAATALRQPHRQLRWDGQDWHLGPIGADLTPGAVTVALDLGAWILLRFDTPTTRSRTIWLPLQRRGLQADWHALRCAIYSPRPVPKPGEADA